MSMKNLALILLLAVSVFSCSVPQVQKNKKHEITEKQLYDLITEERRINDINLFIAKFSNSTRIKEVYYILGDLLIETGDFDQYAMRIPGGRDNEEVEKKMYESISLLDDCRRYLEIYKNGRYINELEPKCIEIAIRDNIIDEFYKIFPKSEVSIKELIKDRNKKKQEDAHKNIINEIISVNKHPTHTNFIYLSSIRSWVPGRDYEGYGKNMDKDALKRFDKIWKYDIEGKCINGISISRMLDKNLFGNKQCESRIFLMPVFRIIQKVDKKVFTVLTTYQFLFRSYTGLRVRYMPAILKTKTIDFKTSGDLNKAIWVKYVGVFSSKDNAGFNKDYYIFEEYNG